MSLPTVYVLLHYPTVNQISTILRSGDSEEYSAFILFLSCLKDTMVTMVTMACPYPPNGFFFKKKNEIRNPIRA